MWPAVEPMFTTWPRRRATMCGRIARVTLSSPFRLVSIMRSQSSGSPSWILAIPLASPALLMRTSGTCPPPVSSAAAALTAARSRTSTWASRTAVPCCWCSSAASCSSRSRRRAHSARLAPSPANRRAHASPIPELAPVMRMSFPLMRFIASSHVPGMPQGIAPRLRPYAQAMRLATDLDAVHEAAGPRVEDVHLAVVAPRQPQLPAVGGHVPHVGTPATRHRPRDDDRSEEHTSELQSLAYLVCRLLLEK